ncbi:MAG TPA: hypothetical protein VF328_03690, partial [Mycobacterium sp.]
TEAKVLQLIDRYKPVSRWPEGIFRATTSEGHIGVTGACLRFIYHLSDAPELEGFQADFYGLFGPTDATVGAASNQFTVGMPAGSAIALVINVVPNDGGAGGVFTPSSLALTTENPVGKFTYKPAISGTVSIATVNDGGLTDPPPLTLVAKEIPETISGLLGWWKSTSVTPVPDASPIAGWPAKFGGFNALPPVPANAPAYYSGLVRGVRDTAARLETHPVNEDYLEELEEAEARAGTHPGIWFTGSSKLVFTPPIDLTGGWTCIALAYNANGDIKIFSSSTSGQAAPEIIDQNAQYSYLSDIGHRYSAAFETSCMNRFAIYCQTSDFATGAVQIMLDGMTYPVSYGGGWPYGGPTIDQIGMRGDGSASTAHIVEFMIYRGIKTPAELEVLHDYMRAEYGVPINKYKVTAPAMGAVGAPSTPFTVRLPFGLLSAVPVVITPNDSGAGGVFTPSSLTLSGGTPSGTFTYTPATEGVKTITTTNDGGLTDPAALSYTAVVYVDTWADKSGKGHTMTQTVAGKKPYIEKAVQNARPCVTVYSALGTPVSMNIVPGISTTPPWTIIAVMVRFGSQFNPVSSTTVPNPQGGPRMYGGYPPAVLSGGNQVYNDTATDKSGAFAIYTVDTSPSTWANGVGGAAATVLSTAAASPLFDAMGSDITAAQYGDGKLVALLICKSLLTVAQRQNAEATLAAKYGIAVPAGTLIDLATLPALEAWWEADTLLPLVIDAQSAEGFGSWSALDGSALDTGGTFVSTGGKLFSAVMWLVKQGAPTGNVVCKIWSAAGVLLATSNPIPVALLPTTLLTTTEFTFPIAEQIALLAGTSYMITAGNTGTPANCVMSSYGSRTAASMAAIRNSGGGFVFYDT